MKILEMLTPGLATRETIAQSSCLVFDGDRIMTFNEEILASIKSPLPNLKGAVKAKPLLDLLSKLSDDVDLEVDQVEKELSVKGKGRKAGIRMEAEVLLPVEAVEKPEVWRPINPEFCEAIGFVYSCAGTDESKFVLTCVHISPDYMEACDRFQLCRFPMKTGVEQDILIRAAAAKRILGYDMSEVSETPSWIHFRNSGGFTMSLRRFIDTYPKTDAFVSTEGTQPIILPGALEEVVSRAEVFSGENTVGNHLLIDLTRDYIQIEGQGASGWYKERKKVTYNGEQIKFQIAPKLLVEITKKSAECAIAEGRLCVNTGKFAYATCTVMPEVAPTKKEEATTAA